MGNRNRPQPVSGVVDSLIARGVFARREIRKCPPRSIRRLERELGIRVPAAYHDFLRLIGRGAGRFILDLHVEAFYPMVLELNADLSERLPGVTVPPG